MFNDEYLAFQVLSEFLPVPAWSRSCYLVSGARQAEQPTEGGKWNSRSSKCHSSKTVGEHQRGESNCSSKICCGAIERKIIYA